MPQMHRTELPQQGYSLVEMLVSVAVMTIIVGGIFVITTQNQMYGRNGSDASETIQNARSAFELMSREIKSAGLGYPARQAFAAASPVSLTIRGTFPKITAVATAANPATGELTLNSIAGFAAGQRVLLIDANSSVAAYTSITSVDTATGTLTVATGISTQPAAMWPVPATAATTINDFGAGTSVSVVQCITYSLTSDGRLMRSVAPELGATATETSELASSVLDANGAGGLRFRYYDAGGTEIVTSTSSPTPAADLTRMTLVGLDLSARSRNRAFFTKEFQTVLLTTEAKPRG
jgi:prepilin-type N-terminal cleavage/methylation domain-containing protein